MVPLREESSLDKLNGVESPRSGQNNVLVDDEMRQCLEDIINEKCVLTHAKPDKWRVEEKTSWQTSDS